MLRAANEPFKRAGTIRSSSSVNRASDRDVSAGYPRTELNPMLSSANW